MLPKLYDLYTAAGTPCTRKKPDTLRPEGKDEKRENSGSRISAEDLWLGASPTPLRSSFVPRGVGGREYPICAAAHLFSSTSSNCLPPCAFPRVPSSHAYVCTRERRGQLMPRRLTAAAFTKPLLRQSPNKTLTHFARVSIQPYLLTRTPTSTLLPSTSC